MTDARSTLPEKGTDWPALREQLVAKGARDVDWRHARTAVYVFHAGDDVLEVAKEASYIPLVNCDHRKRIDLNPGSF